MPLAVDGLPSNPSDAVATVIDRDRDWIAPLAALGLALLGLLATGSCLCGSLSTMR